jgi:hypothetical protein
MKTELTLVEVTRETPIVCFYRNLKSPAEYAWQVPDFSAHCSSSGWLYYGRAIELKVNGVVQSLEWTDSIAESHIMMEQAAEALRDAKMSFDAQTRSPLKTVPATLGWLAVV